MAPVKQHISLNGRWRYLTDNQTKLSFKQANEFLKQRSTPSMNIPSNWEKQGLHNFDGAVWFLKEFQLSQVKIENEISLLKFHGVDYFCEAWLNGKLIGKHEGYFQTFNFDVTNLLTRDGLNTLIVKVTSPREIPGKVWPLKKQLIKGIFNHHDCRPGGWSYEFGQDQNTGGIWNNVELTTSGTIGIEHCKITSSLSASNKGIIHGEVFHINGFTKKTNITCGLLVELENKKILEKSVIIKVEPRTGKSSFSFTIDEPEIWQTWDLGNQPLYHLTLTSDSFGEFKTQFGIRTVSLDAHQNFYLNGKKLFLRGTNLIPTQFLSELSPAKIGKLVSAIKEAHINIVRVHAHVNRKELYEEFDKAGILVWQDFPLQWTYDESPAFAKNAVNQIKEMTLQFYNHPSIAFWCCHNEPGEQIQTLDKKLYAAVYQEDSSRIIRMASNYEEHPYDGWYWGNKEHFAAAPMGPLVTEFGAQALPQLSSLKNFLSSTDIANYNWSAWEYHNFQFDQTFNIAGISRGKNINEFIANSQKYQADLVTTAIEFYRRKKNNGITGIFQFMFADCWPSITWSVVDFYGKKKLGYYALQKAFKPLSLSVRLRQEKFLPEAKFNSDVWILNDLHTSLKNCSLSYIWKQKVLLEIKNFSIESNDNKFFLWESLLFHLPKEMKLGKHKISVRLESNGNLLDMKELNFTLVSKI